MTPIAFTNQEDVYGSVGFQGSIYASGLDDVDVKSSATNNNKIVPVHKGGKIRSNNAGSIVS